MKYTRNKRIQLYRSTIIGRGNALGISIFIYISFTETKRRHPDVTAATEQTGDYHEDIL